MESNVIIGRHRLASLAVNVSPCPAVELRRLKLLRDQRTGRLSHLQAAELRGILAYPGYYRAAELIRRLDMHGSSSEPAGIMVEWQRELEAIQADVRQLEKEIRDRIFPNAALDRYHLLTAYFHARQIRMAEGWDMKDPRQTIDNIVGAIPETIEPIPRDQAERMVRCIPSSLELFMLSRLSDPPAIESDKDIDGLRSWESIHCLRDEIRTKKFILAIKEAIEKLEADRDEIYVCDAGCGAMPVMAIYAVLASPKAKAVALEINPQSVQMARQFVRAFGLEDRIEVIEADATKYRPGQIDLLVSETMDACLIHEPLVQIMANLAPHMREGGIILPTRVVIKAAVISMPRLREFGNMYLRIADSNGVFFDVPWQEMFVYYAGDALQKIWFSLSVSDLQEGEYAVLLANDVQIGSQTLEVNKSLITMPKLALQRNGRQKLETIVLEKRPAFIAVSYKPGGNLDGAATLHLC